ncbi:hypothetical protein GCM10020254_80980 [Streptomyces goshikiensis]
MSAAVTAVRGPFISFVDDPFLTGREDAFVYESDGLLICEDGVIIAAGDYGALRERLPQGVEPVHYPDHVISAGVCRYAHPLRADGDHRGLRFAADRLAEPLHLRRGAAVL